MSPEDAVEASAWIPQRELRRFIAGDLVVSQTPEMCRKTRDEAWSAIVRPLASDGFWATASREMSWVVEQCSVDGVWTYFDDELSGEDFVTFALRHRYDGRVGHK